MIEVFGKYCLIKTDTNQSERRERVRDEWRKLAENNVNVPLAPFEDIQSGEVVELGSKVEGEFPEELEESVIDEKNNAMLQAMKMFTDQHKPTARVNVGDKILFKTVNNLPLPLAGFENYLFVDAGDIVARITDSPTQHEGTRQHHER